MLIAKTEKSAGKSKKADNSYPKLSFLLIKIISFVGLIAIVIPINH